MIKSILAYVRRPEPFPPPWRIDLPLILVALYFIARLVGLSATLSLRNETFDNPSSLSLFLGGIIASVPMLWVIVQLVSNASVRASEANRQPPKSVSETLRLTESVSRPLWLIWLAGLAVIIALDIVALILGSAEVSLPLGLDRMNGVSTATWLTAILLFLVAVPLIEELIFRGMLYPAFAKDDNLQAVALSTVVFVVFYLLQVAGDSVDWRTAYTGVIFPAVLGMTCGIARAHSKSIWGAIGCHVAFNLWLILKAFLVFN